jgi:glycosyltransferase involved in cell wall biosynthesis
MIADLQPRRESLADWTSSQAWAEIASVAGSSSPLVSILLPVFNAADTLPACVRSIRRQTETDWECVAVDDGSGDESAERLREAARTDSRFVVISTAHRGIVATLNAGLARCRGRYVARMDADDLMHRERLARQIAALEADESMAAVGCHVRLFPRRGLRQGRREYERWLNSIDSAASVAREIFVECPIAHPTLMIRRERLAAFGYRDCSWPEDYDLLLRLMNAGERIGVVASRLLCWRDDPRRLSRTSPRYALEQFPICKAAFLAGGFLRDSNAYVLWGYGHTGRAIRRELLKHGKRPAHIVELHPGRLGNFIHGARVILPDELRTLPRLPLIASVAGAEPRNEIRVALEGMGFRELHDFVCVA